MQTKKSLDMHKIISSSTLMIQFFFQSLFLGSVMFISSGFENHVIDLGGSQGLCSCIYVLNMIGFSISLLFVNKIYKQGDNRKGFFLLGSITIIFFNNFFGPDPFLNIRDADVQLIWVAVAFFMIGIGQGCIAVLLVPEYKDVLRTIFPDEPEELLMDMSPALYLSAYSLAEFANSIIGGYVIDALGFDWTSMVYCICLCFYFVIYWVKQLLVRQQYKKMVEEQDISE